jgi:hypothetical protein
VGSPLSPCPDFVDGRSVQLSTRSTSGTMHYLVRNVGGRSFLAIASVSIGALVLAGTSCSDAATQASAGPSSSIVEIRQSETSAATTGPPTSGNPVEGRCLEFAPSGFGVFSRAEAISVAEIRNIVVVTLPPTPASLLLPGHDAAEEAVMCWATDGAATLVQYWVTRSGESKVLCTTRVAESTSDEQIEHPVCV